MPAKTTKTKSNVARPKGKAASLNKKIKFNWKIAVVIGVILVAALGYLFVRLSEAGNSRVFAAGRWVTTGQDLSGRVINKNDGTQAIESVPVGGAERISIKIDINGVYNGKTSYCFELATSGPARISSWAGVNFTSKFGFFEQLRGSTNGRITKCFDLEAKDASASKTVYLVVDAAQGQKAYFYSMREELLQPAGAAPGTKTTPSPAPNNACSGVYGQGNQGPCVTIIQTRLRDLGYNVGAIDGIYGSQTASAVRNFQARNGLTQDGIVGPVTWNKLTDPNAARKQ